MKDTEIRQERDREVYSLYLKCLHEKDYSSIKEIAQEISLMRAPKFYISSKSLVNYFRDLEHRTLPPNLHPGTKEKIFELYRRYNQFSKDHPDASLPRERICEILIDEEAPSFYIGVAYIVAIIRKERENNLEMIVRRYVK